MTLDSPSTTPTPVLESPVKKIFIAILDGLATSAQYADDARFQHLTVTSAWGGCRISISEAVGLQRINYSFVTKALRILTWDVILRLRVFRGMTFDLKWEGTSMATTQP